MKKDNSTIDKSTKESPQKDFFVDKNGCVHATRAQAIEANRS